MCDKWPEKDSKTRQMCITCEQFFEALYLYMISSHLVDKITPDNPTSENTVITLYNLALNRVKKKLVSAVNLCLATISTTATNSDQIP